MVVGTVPDLLNAIERYGNKIPEDISHHFNVLNSSIKNANFSRL